MTLNLREHFVIVLHNISVCTKIIEGKLWFELYDRNDTRILETNTQIKSLPRLCTYIVPAVPILLACMKIENMRFDKYHGDDLTRLEICPRPSIQIFGFNVNVSIVALNTEIENILNKLQSSK